MEIRLEKPKIKVSMIETKHNVNLNDYIREGYAMRYKIHNSFILVDDDMNTIFSTTPITEIIDQFTFKTGNSTYKIEYLNFN